MSSLKKGGAILHSMHIMSPFACSDVETLSAVERIFNPAAAPADVDVLARGGEDDDGYRRHLVLLYSTAVRARAFSET